MQLVHLKVGVVKTNLMGPCMSLLSVTAENETLDMLSLPPYDDMFRTCLRKLPLS